MRAAVAHRERYLARLVLSGWLLRTLLAADFLKRLGVVRRQVRACPGGAGVGVPWTGCKTQRSPRGAGSHGGMRGL